MKDITPQSKSQLHRYRWLPVVVIAIAMTVLAGIILRDTLQLRARIRSELIARDANLLHLVATKHADEPDVELLGSIDDPLAQEWLILETSTFANPGQEQPDGTMLGTRQFSPDGLFVGSFPEYVPPATLSDTDLNRLRKLQPVGHFYPDFPLTQVLGEDGSANTGPLLIISIPIHTSSGQRLAGIAQFLIEGQSTARQLGELNAELARKGVTSFVISSLILGLAIAWAFRKIRRANRLLAERTQNLLKANQELTLAAKTSAVGAVTSHLIHGLKNPLSGLQSFMSTLGDPNNRQAAADFQDAVTSTRRMQSMINQVVNILREENATTQYEITAEELVQLVVSQTADIARSAEVQLLANSTAQAVWPNHVANLVLLILVNLVTNALQATPSGKTVSLKASQEGGTTLFSVEDQGTGFPSHLVLFSPCHSTKEGGSGIGLAVSNQLASHLGARLELRKTSEQGCLFVLALPPGLEAQKSQRAPSAILG